MLSIFQKKRYLVDYLENFTDFHNHLLPGIDDGSPNVDISLELIEKFGKFGVKNFVCTPHVMGEYYPNSPADIGAALQELKMQLPEDVKIQASAEYMMDAWLTESIENDEILPIAGKHVLIEMSYFQAPINLIDILFQLQTKGYKLILAHPERYAFYHNKSLNKYRDLKNRGCKFQLNMLSLSRHYGEGINKMANRLLEEGMIDFISSDCHRMEHLEKIEKIRLNKKQAQLIEPVIEKSKALFG